MPERKANENVKSAPRRRGRDAATETASRRRRQPKEAIDTGADEMDQSSATSGENDAGREREPGKGQTRTLRGELGDTVRDAAIEILGPVARKATTQAAKYAISKGPALARENLGPKLKETVGPALEEAGGPGALVKGALSNASGAGGGLLSKVGLGKGDGKGGQGQGTGRGRRLPVQESIDIAVPVDTAYNQFTQFEDFAKFMFRAEQVKQVDDTHLEWHEKIWGIRRKWEVEITDQRPNERIAWKSESGAETTGVITFHSLDDKLTRVMVTNDFQPHGVLEKTASGFRMSRRALRSDLMRFKAFIEMRDEETGAWRGEIEEGEVSDEEQGADGRGPREEREEERPRARRSKKAEEEDEQPKGRARSRQDEDEDEYDLPEDEYEEEESDEEDYEPEASEEERESEEEEDEPEREREPDERSQRVRRRRPARPRR